MMNIVIVVNKKKSSVIFGGTVRLALISSYTNGLRVTLLKFNFAKCLLGKYSSQIYFLLVAM